MKPLIVSAAMLCAAASPAAAQSVEQRYQGTLFILTATSQCASTVAQANRGFVFNFRTQSNKQFIGLSDAPVSFSIGPTAASGLFGGSGNYAATKIGGGGGVTEFDGAYANFVFTPATFATSTVSVALRGTLRDFDETPGCTVTFRAAGARRPGPPF